MYKHHLKSLSIIANIMPCMYLKGVFHCCYILKYLNIFKINIHSLSKKIRENIIYFEYHGMELFSREIVLNLLGI